MGRIIEAKAVISAEDRTGKVLDGIARKFREAGKSAKVAADFGKAGKELDRAAARLKQIDNFKGVQTSFGQARTTFREAQSHLSGIVKNLDLARKAATEFNGVRSFSRSGGIAQEMAAARKQVVDLERQFVSAQRAVKAAAAGYEAQAAALKSVKTELGGIGGLSKLISEENRLKAAVEGATGALRRQEQLLHAEGRLAAGMGSAGRGQADRIAQGRYLTEGMGQSGRLARAEREQARRAAAEERARVRAERLEATSTLGAGAAVIAAHKGKDVAKSAIESAAAFDLAVRKQRVFTDISPDAQAGLLAQAKQIGQETQFSNIDVVKAQTAAMQGLPESFAPDLKAAVAEGIVGNVRNFSTLMETDLKDGTEIIRGYLQQSGRDISTKEKALAEANKATNQLVKMAKIGGMDGEDVKNFANYAISSATAVGISPEATMSLGALARRGGLRGDVAGVAVRSMASKIASPTQDGIAALNAAGINYSDYVRMPDKLSTEALEGQFRNKLGKGFTPEIRKKLDAINSDKALIADRGKYTQAVVSATGGILGKTKDGKVRASDAKAAAKAVGGFHKVSAQSVDAEGLLDAAMKSNMTLPQLNAWLTDKHGGKGAITQRQWDEFKASKQAIGKAGDDPDWAKKKADEVFAGLGGAVENFKGSIENFVLSVGNANASLVKWSADKLGSGVDSFSKLPEGAQQGLSLGALAGSTLAGIWGTLKLTKVALGLGGKVFGGAAGAGAGAAGAAGAGALAAEAGAGAAAAGAAGAATGGGTAAALLGAGVPIIGAGILAGGLFVAGQDAQKGLVHGGRPDVEYNPGLPGLPADGGAPTPPAQEKSALTNWLQSALPSVFGGGATPVPVEVKALPSGTDANRADPSGQIAAQGNTLDKAAAASATAANGGKPIEATVKPDQITAKVTEIPLVTGEATVTVDNRVNVIMTLNDPMLQAKIEAAAGRAVAKIPLAAGAGRPGATSMPGAASTPGAAK